MFLSIVYGYPGFPVDKLQYLDAASIAIWCVFVCTCCAKLCFISGEVRNWFRGADGTIWLIIQGFVLLFLNPVTWILTAVDGSNEIKQVNGNSITCPSGVRQVLQSWCQSWTLVYFNEPVRKALVILLVVLSNLGPLACLMGCSFIAHFFIFQGLASQTSVTGEVGFGLGSPQGCSLSTDCPQTANLQEALWNQFIALSEVQGLLFLVENDNTNFFYILSFDFFTRLIGMSLLLAVMCGFYSDAVEEDSTNAAKLHSVMIDTAFTKLLTDGKDYLTPDQLLNVLRLCHPECVNPPPL